eukprot:TRINITY_DN4565_c0_g1_i9.p1 TRINITY_DN4565_c0_g1~~TRINITY_DN4565_c0_g1_i9.p1  ORF type:complete len:432 (+),score=92.66 TRINITY_DN4565_c0_g1_i9:60-1355(+)
MGNNNETEKTCDEQGNASTTQGNTFSSWGSIMNFPSTSSTSWDEYLNQSLEGFMKGVDYYIGNNVPEEPGPILWNTVLPHPVSSKKLYRFGNLTFKVGLATMHGWRPTMEDAHCVELSLKNHPDTSFFGIFDGHGGPVVANFLSENLVKKIEELSNVFDPEAITNACTELDNEVLRLVEEKALPNVGSTCIFTIIRFGSGGKISCLFGNIGDSRTVLAKQIENKYVAVGVTTDHSPTNREETLRIERAGGCVINDRVDGMLAVSRAFGDTWFKVPRNASPCDRKVSVIPEFEFHDISPMDMIIMTCDGIYEGNIFSRQSMVDWIQEKSKQFHDVSVICGSLLNECLLRGSRDNMSCMIIKFEDGSDFATNPTDFIPGPWIEITDNTPNNRGLLKFQEVYKEDAKSFGYTLEQAITLRSQMEKQRKTVSDQK